MENLKKLLLEKVVPLIQSKAEEEKIGFVEAALFEQNASEYLDNVIEKDSNISKWWERAMELGYSVEDVTVSLSFGYNEKWYNSTNVELEVPVYGRLSLRDFVFPSRSRLNKTFVMPLIEKEEKEEKEKEERRIKEIEEKTKKIKEKNEKIRKEKEEWIKNYGSDYLKDCLDLNIKANREYVVERAAKEFPGFTVDYTDNAGWDDIFSPSQTIINELKELIKCGAKNIEIVWLTKPPKVKEDEKADRYDGYYEEEFEPREAILIRKYLEYYNLIK